ncbi:MULTISPECIES: HAD hydrolase-like protein [unclassified Methylobacterium]|uniref:HAD hydrolase-like protein n=1 Tax=unclassified Methylobacterium TaxID=2615210 RepID=UPI0006FABFDE|nr:MULTISPECIES: HAD hydrolase-like protein [unclassified Methylobacterium]KQO60871.1 HAD family hydrolase [Methylobacterium sp. Leaf86]KQO88036.1 HAD family hydrolase [Methylobacterium sp. Leaf91]
MRTSYKLAIFDFDGTLADTFPWFCSVINDVAVRYRFRQIDPAETDALRGLSARALIRELGVSPWKLPFITRHMHGLASRDIATISLFPGIRDMLCNLDEAGVTLAIVSSNSEANVRHVLGPCALRFRHYACGASMFGKAKRLNAVMRREGSLGGAIYIGDELRDHDAAKAASCDFGAVTWGYTRGDALVTARPDMVFRHPADIVETIGTAPA